MWSGFVCLMPALVPFVGDVPEMPGVYAAMGWHGNGVAMGSYAGVQIANRISGKAEPDLPAFIGYPPRRFALSKNRRALLRLAYFGSAIKDLV